MPDVDLGEAAIRYEEAGEASPAYVYSLEPPETR